MAVSHHLHHAGSYVLAGVQFGPSVVSHRALDSPPGRVMSEAISSLRSWPRSDGSKPDAMEAFKGLTAKRSHVVENAEGAAVLHRHQGAADPINVPSSPSLLVISKLSTVFRHPSDHTAAAAQSTPTTKAASSQLFDTVKRPGMLAEAPSSFLMHEAFKNTSTFTPELKVTTSLSMTFGT